MFNKENGSMMNKNVVVAFILGIIVAAFAYHAYLVYQMRATVSRNATVVNQILQNSAQNQQRIQQQQGAGQALPQAPAQPQADAQGS